jgi:crotonobetainyl-CoA:carnitine CoA-transferase CaiB-like acyl-CoA transferase
MSIADALGVIIGDLFATLGHEEVAFEAQRRGIVCTPVLAPGEVLANEHFRSRGTFTHAEFAPGLSGPVASGFFELDGERQGFRQRAPTQRASTSRAQRGPGRLHGRRRGRSPAPVPLAGLRVSTSGSAASASSAGACSPSTAPT